MNFAAFLPPGIGVEDLFTLMAALAAFAATFAVWQTLVVRDPMQGRLKRIAEQREGLKTSLTRSSGRKRRQVIDPEMARGLVSRLNLLRAKGTQGYVIRLAQAGFRSRDALMIYLLARVAMPAIFGVVGVVLILWLAIIPVPPAFRLPAVLVAVLLGAFAPDMYLRNIADKRRKEMRKATPDTLDLLVICAEAGLAIDAALPRVAREMALASAVIAEELGVTAVELTFLPDRQKAFDNLTQRVDLPAIRALVNTLKQTEKYGTPLAHSLRILSAEFREERLLRAEEKAARLPAILTVPMIIFILPTLFIVLLGPAIMRTIDALRGMT